MATKRGLNDSDKTLSNKRLMKDTQLSSADEYHIYWLDDLHQNPLEYYDVKHSKLRAIIDYLHIFQQFEQFKNIIRKNTETKLFIILNLSSVEKAFPLLKDLEYVISIYIYGDNASMDQHITHAKVHGLFANPNEIFPKLSQTIRIYSRQIVEKENCNPLSAVTKKPERTTDLHSQIETMNWFTYLYDVLEEISPNSNGKVRFVEECRKRYHNNEPTLRIVNEFNETYISERAIWWYTREGFLFRFLNRILRQRDQNEMLLIHFFIYDLAQQLRIESNKNKDAEWMNEHIYRGQLMSIDEIQFIQRRKFQTLYVNTFLSTSTDFELAKIFAGAGSKTETDSEQSVIFDITGLESGGPGEKSVADIHHISFNRDECEILFSPGYTFTADHVSYNANDKFWCIHLDRIRDAYDPNMIFDQYFIKLDVLIRLMLDKIPSNHLNEYHKTNLHSTFENNLALLIEELENYSSVNISLDCDVEENQINDINKRIPPYQLSAIHKFAEYSLNKQYELTPLITITLHDCLANIYKQNGKYNLAFEHFNQAIALADKNENIRTTFNRKISLAQTYKLAENYADAWIISEELEDDDLTESFLYERLFRDIAMEISYDEKMTLCEKYMNCYNYLEYVYTKADLINNGFNIAETYIELGKQFLYACQNNDHAILCFNRYLDIQHLSDPEESLGFGFIYEIIGDAYAFNDKHKAVECYKKALDQHSRACATDSIDIALCWCKLAYTDMEDQIEYVHRAVAVILSIEDEDLERNRDVIASCLLYLAKICIRQESLADIALESCEIIYRIYLYEEDSTPGIDNDFEEWIQLIIDLYRKKNSKAQNIQNY